jgi:hypothetical protein
MHPKALCENRMILLIGHFRFLAKIATSTDDVYKTGEALRAAGAKITREAGPLPGLNTKIVAALDPDGWKTVRLSSVQFALMQFCVTCQSTGRRVPRQQGQGRHMCLLSGTWNGGSRFVRTEHKTERYWLHLLVIVNRKDQI